MIGISFPSSAPAFLNQSEISAFLEAGMTAVAEMHILIVRDRGAAAGCALLDAIYTDPLYRVVAVDRDLESEATERWLRRFSDQRFSLTDAVSFEIMRRERIGQVLALDHHFEIAGYTLLPDPRGKTAKRRLRNPGSGPRAGA